MSVSKINIVFASLFSIVLLFPAVTVLFSDAEEENVEFRNKAEVPSFTIEGLLTYPGHLNDYINDNFGGRSEIIACNSFIRIKLFNSSPNSRQVMLGKEGWLFLNEKEIHKIHDNLDPLTEKELKVFAHVELERAEWLKLHGIDYYLVIPPVSHTIYEEYLPSNFKRHYDLTKRQQVIRYLKQHTSVKVIDVDSILFANKKRHSLYYKTDTHWTFYGAYYTYTSMINEIRKDHKNIPAPIAEDKLSVYPSVTISNDLSRLIGLPGYLAQNDTAIDIKNNCLKKIDCKTISSTSKNKLYVLQFANKCDTSLPSMFMYRDSYANYLYNFLGQHFDTTTVVWDTRFDPVQILKAKPDIVIYEAAEHLSMHLADLNHTAIRDELKSRGVKIYP